MDTLRVVAVVLVILAVGESHLPFQEKFEIWSMDLKPGYKIVANYNEEGKRCFCKIPDECEAPPTTLSTTTTPTSTPVNWTEGTTPAPTSSTSTPAPTPAPTSSTSTPAPTPAPTSTSTPAPTPAPTTTSTPAPTPAPTSSTSTPAPTPAPTSSTSTPAPTPAPSTSTPATTSTTTPEPTHDPIPSTSAPTSAPTSSTSTPAPTPAPTSPTPAPTSSTSTPPPTPAPTSSTSTPTPTPSSSTTTKPSTTTTKPTTTTAGSVCGVCNKTIILTDANYPDNTVTNDFWATPNYPNNYTEGCFCCLRVDLVVRGSILLTFNAGDIIFGKNNCAYDKLSFYGSFLDLNTICDSDMGDLSNFITKNHLAQNIQGMACFTSTSADGGKTQRGFNMTIQIQNYLNRKDSVENAVQFKNARDLVESDGKEFVNEDETSDNDDGNHGNVWKEEEIEREPKNDLETPVLEAPARLI